MRAVHSGRAGESHRVQEVPGAVVGLGWQAGSPVQHLLALFHRLPEVLQAATRAVSAHCRCLVRIRSAMYSLLGVDGEKAVPLHA